MEQKCNHAGENIDLENTDNLERIQEMRIIK